MALLTKSRFKLGMECPNKLFYSANRSIYADQKTEDSFLESLAEGGFQVEACARMYYPSGSFLSVDNAEYDLLWQQTEIQLAKKESTIYEAAFKFEHFFIRADIIVKNGNNMQLIEVKAKSFHSGEIDSFFTKTGTLRSEWIPYFFDLAFQKYVIQLLYPDLLINAQLMMADKSKTASINGMNQLFRIPRHGDPRKDIKQGVATLEEIGNPVLTAVNVDQTINKIIHGEELYNGKTFKQLIHTFGDIVKKGNHPNSPITYKACKSCEFKATKEDERKGMKSGYKECFKKQYHWKEDDFDRPTIFDIWNFRSGQTVLKQDRIFMEQLTEDVFNCTPGDDKLSTGERQWLQVFKTKQGDKTPYIHQVGLRKEMDEWQYPYHFIDFETSAVALPFNSGSHPYEQVAFQFSHHVLHQNGVIEHQAQYLNNTPGEFPNFKFIRALKQTLEEDNGTIFRYAAHENTILNVIKTQLEVSNEIDKMELIDFILSITKSTNKATQHWEGNRNMVDLRKVIVNYYFNPLSQKGSNSIKYILPAVLETSKYLQQKYSQPISTIQLTSKNFPSSHIWLKLENNKPINPYKTLPPLFDSWDALELEESISGLESIKDGGAALTAYSKLQFYDMAEKERQEISNALLKYCELDTLAMVMIVEHFLTL